MEPRAELKLCTFQVCTHLGRHQRLGAHKDGRIVDVNFATAWYMAQTGEAEPHRLADALVPSNLLDFLRSGLRAIHTAEELFLGAGPRPGDWWRHDPPLRGPNDETLVYRENEVELRELFGATGDVRGPCECEWGLAAVIGRCGIAGYTLQNRFTTREAAGPYLVTPDQFREICQLELSLRVNGAEQGRHHARGNFNQSPGLMPGDVISGGALGTVSLKPGDVVELEAPKIGVLRNRVT